LKRRKRKSRKEEAEKKEQKRREKKISHTACLESLRTAIAVLAV
jgi:hypothetical protein